MREVERKEEEPEVPKERRIATLEALSQINRQRCLSPDLASRISSTSETIDYESYLASVRKEIYQAFIMQELTERNCEE